VAAQFLMVRLFNWIPHIIMLSRILLQQDSVIRQHWILVLTALSPAIDGGANPGQGGNWELKPEWEYKHPADRIIRETFGALDIGALEAISTSATYQEQKIKLSIWRNGVYLGHTVQLPEMRWQLYSLDGRLLDEWNGEGAMKLPKEMVVVVLFSEGRFVGSEILP
jgi:hypothetical protein